MLRGPKTSAHDGPYPPIADYGMVGDLRSAALLSKGGSIDWMCLPRFDSQAVFSRILDWERGGYFEVCPAAESLAFRRYRTDSNVMETMWSNERRQLRVVDWMPIPNDTRKPKPPDSLRLIRMLQPIAGATEWRATFKPRFDYGRQEPEFEALRPGMLAARAPGVNLFLQYPEEAELVLEDGVARIRGQAMPGHRGVFLLHWSSRRPAPGHLPIEDAHAWLHQTDDFWVNWIRSTTYRGRFDEPLHRCALTLKLMQYLPSGAYVAAPTSSLPESPGGSLNWDYRYTWIRDTADLVNALSALGFDNEADSFLRWVRRVHDRHPKDFQIMYAVDGNDRIPEYVLEELPGYRGSRPARIGNAAVEQLQLDIYGELLLTAFTVWHMSHRFPRPRRQVVIDVIDHILKRWDEPDSGIWESRQRPRKYLWSRVLMWAGLDRALKMDSVLRMGGTRRAAVQHTCREMKRQVLEGGYDHELGAFTQAIGYKDLDASALAVAMYEMLPANDPRVVSTVRVLQERLSNDGFLYRYVPEKSEFHQPEGVFIICTCWLVNVLATMGRKEEAEQLFSRVTEAANDIGLFAEEYDPKTGEMLGNFPQALTHLGLINAILNLEGHPSGKGRRSGQTRGTRR